MSRPDPDPTSPPPPIRILLVEDSFLVAHSVARMLGDMGAEVIGPAGTIDTAMQLLRDRPIDAAVLDINLGGETVEPVAHALIELKRPLVFITGYSSPALTDPTLLAYPRLTKPVDAPTLRHTLQSALTSSLPSAPYHPPRSPPGRP